MAVRKNLKQVEKTREKIKLTNLLLRVQQFALGEPDNFGNKVEMNANQLKAALSLINKKLPDLTAADITINQEGPESRQEMFEKVKAVLGEEWALKLAPEFKPEEHRTLN